MSDPLKMNPSLDGPARNGQLVTPDDELVYNPPLRFLWVGVAGDVVIVTPFDETLTFTAPAGAIIPFMAKQVLEASDADQIIGGLDGPQQA